MKATIVLLAFFLTSWGTLAQDIRSNTEGLSISGTASYSHWASDYFDHLDETEPNGLGGGVRIGYGINQRLEVFLRLEGHTFRLNLPEEWNTYKMGTLSGGLRVNMGGTLRRLRPFFEVAYSSQNLTINPVFLNGDYHEFQMRGPALSLAGGVNFFLTSNLALNASLGASFGKINRFLVSGISFTDQPDISTSQVQVGISYFIF